MSEIRERAKEWLKAPVSMVRAEDIVVDLLAELERVENSREAECMECEKLACTEIRQQAAREAVEIIIKETKPHPLFQGSFCNLVISAIKAHFAIKGE